MLGGEEDYVQEFAEAAVQSFQEFSENYSKYLLARNETEFRKAGHKIKPVAIMLGIDQIVENYEYEKTQFGNDRNIVELEESADKMNEICTRVLAELTDIISGN